MTLLSAETKHHILLEYDPRDHTHSFRALAARHNIKGGAEVVRRWHARWNRTVSSLKRLPGAGRKRTFTPMEVSRHIRAPVLAANRAHRAISYTQLYPRVSARTGKKFSIQTLRRYGRKTLKIKSKTTIPRTVDECKLNAHLN